MRWPWTAKQEREQAMLQALERMTVAQSQAFTALAEVMAQYLNSFKVEGECRTWANDDHSEARLERERLAKEPEMIPADWPANERTRLQLLLTELDG
jgi:hypothetical protein